MGSQKVRSSSSSSYRGTNHVVFGPRPFCFYLLSPHAVGYHLPVVQLIQRILICVDSATRDPKTAPRKSSVRHPPTSTWTPIIIPQSAATLTVDMNNLLISIRKCHRIVYRGNYFQSSSNHPWLAILVASWHGIYLKKMIADQLDTQARCRPPRDWPLAKSQHFRNGKRVLLAVSKAFGPFSLTRASRSGRSDLCSRG